MDVIAAATTAAPVVHHAPLWGAFVFVAALAAGCGIPAWAMNRGRVAPWAAPSTDDPAATR